MTARQDMHLWCFIVEGSIDCTIEDVLRFFTGTDKILGFEKLKLKVSFIDELFATASTCDFLPMGHCSDRNNFVDALIMSFKSNDGFGTI